MNNMSQDEIETIMRETLFDLVTGVDTADGCYVEPDGVCPHGYKSPLLLLGMI